MERSVTIFALILVAFAIANNWVVKKIQQGQMAEEVIWYINGPIGYFIVLVGFIIVKKTKAISQSRKIFFYLIFTLILAFVTYQYWKKFFA